MYILTIKTDAPEAEISLYNERSQIGSLTWAAHRELAETIHVKIDELLEQCNVELHDLGGIVVYKGPGSFTGLRIGISVANALGDGLSIPIIGQTGQNWVSQGIRVLPEVHTGQIAVPHYGAEARTTKPKK